MCDKLNILVANPAGNKTIFVLDRFEKSEYKKIANKLLENREINAEQIGFIIPASENDPGRMEMCGQEFCGNASRSYALYLAKLLGINGSGLVTIRVSGIDDEVEVEVDTSSNYTKIAMPIPTKIMAFPLKLCQDAQLVILNGILHLVVFDQPATLDFFNDSLSSIREQYDAPAIGVMFFDTLLGSLTPVVWVRDINSIYFEGSCASGSVATAAVLSRNFGDGIHTFILPQPEGILEITIMKENGSINKAYLQGNVTLGDPIQVYL